ncbi:MULTISPECIES: hypothetical protein [unclassified Nocardioides]|uniref:hypothetical protein n=1 Tax=unclassified Nocardioides TaxID=2615069 RepID=UPI0009F09B66|nr:MULTISPECIES: hypothetical protein [unclassified Nocardioides]GAW51563.1 uncharacterized protein PD653B2_3906 [Nocardioides sp. PD653-B2]GAW54896.1 uncharacterized protein PD653_2311 [Nocardioides sp. PD653]
MNDETLLSTELSRRAEDVLAPPLSFESVRGRADAIRRRRRGGAAAVAAVVALAVIVPTVLSGGSGGSDGIEPAPAPPTAPGSSVLHDGTLTLPDGETVPVDVDNADVSQVGVLTDGRIVVAMMDPTAVRVYGPDGSLEEQYPVETNAITMSAADDAVAWVAEDLSVRVLASGVAEPATLPGIPMPGQASGGIDAVLDPQHLLVGDHTTTTGLLTADGVADLTTSEPFRVIDVSPGGDLWSVAFVPTVDHEQYGCSGLYDPEADEVVAQRCDTPGLRFSPDGKHLLSLAGDNNMYGEATTFDLDLQPAGTFAPEGETVVVSRAGWADPTHLVVGVTDWQTGRWSLVRVGLDGSDPEVVVPEGPGRNPETIAEFVVSE